MKDRYPVLNAPLISLFLTNPQTIKPYRIMYNYLGPAFKQNVLHSSEL